MEPRLQRGQVAAHHRADIGVDHRRAGALIFARFGQHLVADRQEPAGQRIAQDLGHRLFVRRIDVAVEEADRHRLDRALGEPGGERVRGADVERPDHLAPRPHAFGKLKAAAARHQRRRLLVERLVEARHADAAHLQHVAEALGGDQRGRRALAFQDRVGGDGGGVEDLLEAIRREPEPRRQRDDPGEDGAAEIVRGGGQLAGGERAFGGQAGDIGEGAADIGRDAVAGSGGRGRHVSRTGSGRASPRRS